MKLNYCKQCGRLYNKESHSKDYCRKHELQLKKYNKFLDSNPRNNFDPNEFRIYKEYTEFDTYNQNTGEVNGTFKIDTEDLLMVSKFKWRNVNGYAKNNQQHLLHRMLLQAKLGQQVDHIDINTYNNTKDNLRIVNNSINSSNRNSYNKLNIKGVSKHNNGKFSAYIRVNDKQYHSPTYSTIKEAAFARFILEQTFTDYVLKQVNIDYYKDLSIELKNSIIEGIKNKFNID